MKSLQKILGAGALLCALTFTVMSFVADPSDVKSSGVGIRSYVLQDLNDTSTDATTAVPTDLVFPIGANKEVAVVYYVPLGSASATSGSFFTFTVPAGAQALNASIEAWSSSDSLLLAKTVIAAAGAGRGYAPGTASQTAVIRLYIRTGSTAGNVTLNFRQAVLDGSNPLVFRRGAYADILKF